MRVVIDNNLLISAMLWGRGPGRLLGAAVRGEQKIFLSETFLSELGNVIVREKFENRLRLKSLSARSLLDAILDTASIVSAPSIPAPDSLRDPDDAHVLACALAAEADAIVTGDKDLLVAQGIRGHSDSQRQQGVGAVGRAVTFGIAFRAAWRTIPAPMKRILSFFTLVLLAAFLKAEDARCYELRIYKANEGKLAALQARFRDHTCKLFKKHGLTNVGYWVPVDAKDARLVYVISSPNRAAHKKSWRGFLNDPDWKKAFAASIKDGRLVAKIDSTFLSATDYSPAVKPAKAKGGRVFELRTYVTAENRLKNLHARFRDHTCKIFENHGMTNIAYWTPMDADKGKTNTLTYLISHASQGQAGKNWRGFGGDPAWEKARAASEADGKILAKRPARLYLKATDFSPIH